MGGFADKPGAGSLSNPATHAPDGHVPGKRTLTARAPRARAGAARAGPRHDGKRALRPGPPHRASGPRDRQARFRRQLQGRPDLQHPGRGRRRAGARRAAAPGGARVRERHASPAEALVVRDRLRRRHDGARLRRGLPRQRRASRALRQAPAARRRRDARGPGQGEFLRGGARRPRPPLLRERPPVREPRPRRHPRQVPGAERAGPEQRQHQAVCRASDLGS